MYGSCSNCREQNSMVRKTPYAGKVRSNLLLNTECSEDENSTVSMNLTSRFKPLVHHFEKQLRQIDESTSYLQTDFKSLSDSHIALEMLIETATTSRTRSTLHFLRVLAQHAVYFTYSTYRQTRVISLRCSQNTMG